AATVSAVSTYPDLGLAPQQNPAGHPVRHRLALRAVRDLVGDQTPPVALLADAPATQRPLDNLVHLQTVRVVAPVAVRLAGKEHGQIDEHRHRRTHHPERLPDGL